MPRHFAIGTTIARLVSDPNDLAQQLAWGDSAAQLVFGDSPWVPKVCPTRRPAGHRHPSSRVPASITSAPHPITHPLSLQHPPICSLDPPTRSAQGRTTACAASGPYFTVYIDEEFQPRSTRLHDGSHGSSLQPFSTAQQVTSPISHSCTRGRDTHAGQKVMLRCSLCPSS